MTVLPDPDRPTALGSYALAVLGVPECPREDA